MGVSRGLTNSPLDCWFWHISGLRAAALRRLASETRLRAQCGAVALFAPLSTRNKKQPPDRDTVRGQFFMPVMGVEPRRCHHQRILSPSRLPIPTHRHRKLYYYTCSLQKSQAGRRELAYFFAGPVVF